MATEPPPSVCGSGACSAWTIFDTYTEDQERLRMAEEEARAKALQKRGQTANADAELPDMHVSSTARIPTSASCSN